MTRDDFRNALSVLIHMETGIISSGPMIGLEKDPVRWFLRASDDQQDEIFAAIQKTLSYPSASLGIASHPASSQDHQD